MNSTIAMIRRPSYQVCSSACVKAKLQCVWHSWQGYILFQVHKENIITEQIKSISPHVLTMCHGVGYVCFCLQNVDKLKQKVNNRVCRVLKNRVSGMNVLWNEWVDPNKNDINYDLTI